MDNVPGFIRGADSAVPDVMRRLVRNIAIVLVLLGTALAGVVALALQTEPLVATRGKLDPDAVRRARAILRQHDPRHLAERGVREVRVEAVDLDLALGYVVTRALRGGATADVTDDRLHLRVTLPAREGHFVNLDIHLRGGAPGELPSIERLKVGQLAVPGGLATWLMGVALRQGPELADGTSFASLLHNVRFEDDALHIAYEWRADLLDRIRASVLDDADKARIEVYQHALAMAVAELRSGDSVAVLLGPLFKLALDRSVDGDGIAENRALLVAVSAWASGRTLPRLLPEAAAWPRAKARVVRLHGRRDLAQHFLVSGGIAALGGSALADAAGLFKEVDDSRFGSGFSFTDIAADRAGTRFATMAISTPAAAARVQRWMARGVTDFDLMPHPRDLPEYLDEEEFARRFGEVDSPAYRAMIDDIDARISARGFYRGTRAR